MHELDLVKKAYPFAEINGVYHKQWNYIPLIETFGEVVLKVEDPDLSGDCRVLLWDGDQLFGILWFGFGSCSGCDALKQCGSYEDLLRLHLAFARSIEWKEAQGLYKYVTSKDWATHPLMHGINKGRTETFLKRVARYLEEVEGCTTH